VDLVLLELIYRKLTLVYSDEVNELAVLLDLDVGLLNARL